MNKFKIGDLVQHSLTKNIYEIAELRDRGDAAKLKGYESSGFFSMHCYSLVAEKPVGVDFSRPVTTRDGRPVRILCTDKKGSEYPIVGLITDNNEYQSVNLWLANGTFANGFENPKYDLINPPVKKYINLFKNDVGRVYYDTCEEAEKAGKSSMKANPGVGYVKTIEVEI